MLEECDAQRRRREALRTTAASEIAAAPEDDAVRRATAERSVAEQQRRATQVKLGEAEARLSESDVPATDTIDVQIDCFPLTPDVLVGAYTVAVNDTALRGVLAFFAIGTYVYATHDVDANCLGLEYGAYSFNASTQTLTFANAAIDRNSYCGVHSDSGNIFISGTGVSKNAATKVITGTFANTGTFGFAGGGPGTNALTFTPVASTTGQLLGAWSGVAGMVLWQYNADGTALAATPSDVQNATPAQPAGIDDACLTGVVPTASS